MATMRRARTTSRATGRCLVATACLALAVGCQYTGNPQPITHGPRHQVLDEHTPPPVVRPLTRRADNLQSGDDAIFGESWSESNLRPAPVRSEVIPAAHVINVAEPANRTRSGQEPPTPDQVARAHPGELSLNDVLAAALSTSPDLVTASEQLQLAEAALGRARAEFYPTMGITQEYGITNGPARAFMFQLNQTQLQPTTNFNQPGSQDDFHTQLMLKQSLYTGERRRRALDQAAARRESQVFQLEAVQNQLAFAAAEGYYRLLQAHVLVGVRKEAVDQVQQHLKIVQSRYRNDTAVKSDVLTVEVRLAEVREALISAQNQLELAWNVLENVVGAPLTRQSLPTDVEAAPWTAPIEDLEAAVAEAQVERPEVGVLAGQRRAASAAVGIAESSQRLTADAVASYDVNTSSFKHGNDSYFLGLVLQLNLFDAGRTEWGVSQALARVRELRAREQRLTLDIQLDVQRSHLQLIDAKQRLQVATQAITQASESLREIEVRYRGQASTITQLIDAQVALSNARVRRANAEADVEIARAALQRAVGRLVNLAVD